MLLCSLTSYLGYDLYSGILHVMMDHPDNISMPILGQACLEFQWHHTIPSDIVRKDFIYVCGDINMAVVILVPIYVCVLGINSYPGNGPYAAQLFDQLWSTNANSAGL